MIVYSLDKPHSLESVTTKWIPLVIEIGGPQKVLCVLYAAIVYAIGYRMAFLFPVKLPKVYRG